MCVCVCAAATSVQPAAAAAAASTRTFLYASVRVRFGSFAPSLAHSLTSQRSSFSSVLIKVSNLGLIFEQRTLYRPSISLSLTLTHCQKKGRQAALATALAHQIKESGRGLSAAERASERTAIVVVVVAVAAGIVEGHDFFGCLRACLCVGVGLGLRA